MLRSHLHAQNKRDRLVAAGHKPRCGYFPTPNHGLAAIDEMTFNKKKPPAYDQRLFKAFELNNATVCSDTSLLLVSSANNAAAFSAVIRRSGKFKNPMTIRCNRLQANSDCALALI